MPAPIAPKRPVAIARHGHERVDPYAWLKADNWQEVMRDPQVLDPDIRKYLEAENDWYRDQMADTEALQATLFCGNARPDQGRRFDRAPWPTGPGPTRSAMWKAAQHPLMVRQPRDGGAETVLVDGKPARGWTQLFQARRIFPCPRSRHRRLGGRRQGLGILHSSLPRRRNGSRSGRRNRGDGRRRRLGGRRPACLLCAHG